MTASSSKYMRLWLVIELLGVFVALPGLCAAGYLPLRYLLLVIALLVLFSYLWLNRADTSLREAWSLQGRRMLGRFLVLAPVLLVLVLALRWASLEGYLKVPSGVRPFGLMIESQRFWILLMLIYPILSVWPQEMIYRRFFFVRYRPLFGEGVWMILGNALVFAWAHVLFANGWAIFLTLLGGWLFAETYRQTRSLAFVCLEHALYGCWIFTVGLGPFFLG